MLWDVGDGGQEVNGYGDPEMGIDLAVWEL